MFGAHAILPFKGYGKSYLPFALSLALGTYAFYNYSALHYHHYHHRINLCKMLKLNYSMSWFASKTELFWNNESWFAPFLITTLYLVSERINVSTHLYFWFWVIVRLLNVSVQLVPTNVSDLYNPYQADGGVRGTNKWVFNTNWKQGLGNGLL